MPASLVEQPSTGGSGVWPTVCRVLLDLKELVVCAVTAPVRTVSATRCDPVNPQKRDKEKRHKREREEVRNERYLFIFTLRHIVFVRVSVGL